MCCFDRSPFSQVYHFYGPYADAPDSYRALLVDRGCVYSPYQETPWEKGRAESPGASRPYTSDTRGYYSMETLREAVEVMAPYLGSQAGLSVPPDRRLDVPGAALVWFRCKPLGWTVHHHSNGYPGGFRSERIKLEAVLDPQGHFAYAADTYLKYLANWSLSVGYVARYFGIPVEPVAAPVMVLS